MLPSQELKAEIQGLSASHTQVVINIIPDPTYQLTPSLIGDLPDSLCF